MVERNNDESRFEEHKNRIKEEVSGRIQNNMSGFLSVSLVGLLALFQILIIVVLPFILRDFAMYFYVVLEICSILLILSLINDNRCPSYKISWICIALALPISGHIMYWLWGGPDSKKSIDENIIKLMEHGRRFLAHDSLLQKRFCKERPMEARLSKYMSSHHFPLYKNNKIVYFPMGEDAFEDIFEQLEKAEKFILIDFFIIAEGGIWDKLHEILKRKVEEGVEVKFLYDDFGAKIRTEKFFQANLEAEGIQVKVFNPIHKYTDKLYMNYRSHQKILVIDGNIGYTGGFNIADEYANLVNRFGVWKDNGIRVEGEAVWGMTVTFLQMWEVCTGHSNIDFNRYRPTKQFEESETYCHVISDGPANNEENIIEAIYRQMIDYADEFLYITTPYLIVESDMNEVLITAVKSGVDVRIITPFIPDKKNVKLLTNYNYGYLLKNGVRIFEYKPGFIHAKTIINERNGIVGTINMDYRSFYLHYENGVWMSDKNVINTIKTDLEKTMEECVEITYDDWKNRPATMKLKQAFLKMFSTLM